MQLSVTKEPTILRNLLHSPSLMGDVRMCIVTLIPWEYDKRIAWEATRGPSIKYVTLEGEEVREGVTVCDRGGGKEHVTSSLYKFLSYI